MAQQWALVGNIVIACAYAAITVAIVVPVRRAGQLRTNRLAVATALIFFSCAVGHAFHALITVYAVQRFGWEFLKPYPSVLGPLNLFQLLMLGLIVYGIAWWRRDDGGDPAPAG